MRCGLGFVITALISARSQMRALMKAVMSRPRRECGLNLITARTDAMGANKGANAAGNDAGAV